MKRIITKPAAPPPTPVAVPAAPPPLLPGLSAAELARAFWIRFLVAFVSVFLAAIVGIPIAEAAGVPESAAGAAVALTSLVGAAVLFPQWRGVGLRSLQEWSRGYSTFELDQGSFWVARGVRERHAFNLPWDHRGLWRLAPDGSVRAVPEPGGGVPGLYRSPNRPGMWELWTGVTWAGYFRDAQVLHSFGALRGTSV